jgi:membrane-bound inhibitor of C-type lysozyme
MSPGSRAAASIIVLALALAGCSATEAFFGLKEQERSRAPVNATEYRCDAGKGFYLRMLDDGASAWVILPEREFRLDKADKAAGASGSRYASRVATLELNGNEARLTDEPDIAYTGCKVPGTEK